jgi:hypothetical protein
MNPNQILRELIEADFEWQKTMQDLTSASKSKETLAEYSPEELDKYNKKLLKLRKRHLQAVKRLDHAITGFAKIPVAMRKKATKPLNWKKLLDSVAAATNMLSRATDNHDLIPTRDNTGLPPFDRSKVIDVTADD